MCPGQGARVLDSTVTSIYIWGSVCDAICANNKQCVMKSLPQSQEDISILISTGKKTEALKRQLLQLRPHMQAE